MADEDGKVALRGVVNGAHDGCVGDIMKGFDRLDEALAKKDRWTGAMSPLDVNGKNFSVKIDASHNDLCQYMHGAAPWVTCVRRGQWRYDASNVPLQGIASVVQSCSEDNWVIALNIEPCLKQGISMENLNSFMDTNQGASYVITDKMKMVKLKPRDVLWVQMGWSSIPFHWHVMQSIAAENANVLMKRKKVDIWKHRAELFLDLLKQTPQ